MLFRSNVLERGFAVVKDAGGNVVVSAQAVTPGAALTLEFHDGKVAVVADGAARRKPRGSKSDEPDQGSLL